MNWRRIQDAMAGGVAITTVDDMVSGRYWMMLFGVVIIFFLLRPLDDASR